MNVRYKRFNFYAANVFVYNDDDGGVVVDQDQKNEKEESLFIILGFFQLNFNNSNKRMYKIGSVRLTTEYCRSQRLLLFALKTRAFSFKN